MANVTYEFEVEIKGPHGELSGVMHDHIEEVPEMTEARRMELCTAKVTSVALEILDHLGASPSTGVTVKPLRKIIDLR